MYSYISRFNKKGNMYSIKRSFISSLNHIIYKNKKKSINNDEIKIYFFRKGIDCNEAGARMNECHVEDVVVTRIRGTTRIPNGKGVPDVWVR